VVQSKKSRQKNLVKKIIKTMEFKLTCSKWDFGQVGQRGKKTIWGAFITKIPGQKHHDFL